MYVYVFANISKSEMSLYFSLEKYIKKIIQSLLSVHSYKPTILSAQ